MNLQDKIVLAHKGYFDKASTKVYRENSREVCEISSRKDYIDIIEVDVRKSKDGVLYCYHGTLPQYWFVLRTPRIFSDIKKKYNVDTLEEVLGVIPDNKIIVLDLKTKSITKADILNSLKGKKYKRIILGNTSLTSVSFLERFNNMPEEFVKVMNGNIFCKFYDLAKLKDKNYKYFEVVFPFQVSGGIIQKVSKYGMEFRCAGLFFSNKESYWKKINAYGIKHVSSDFI
jgi:hypothetical protein